MSVLEAARIADVNTKTWRALEEGTRATRDSRYASIERALNWRPGSVNTVLDGGEPTPAPPHDPNTETAARQPVDPYLDPATGERYSDPTEQGVWDLAGIPLDTRRELIFIIRAKRAAASDSDHPGGTGATRHAS